MFQWVKKLFARPVDWRQHLATVSAELRAGKHPEFSMLYSECCIGGIIRERTKFKGTLVDMIESWRPTSAERRELLTLFWLNGGSIHSSSWNSSTDKLAAADHIDRFLTTGKVYA